MFFCGSYPSPIPAIVHEQPATPYLAAMNKKSGICIPGSIEELFNRLFVDQMLEHPQSLTNLGIFESLGVRQHNRNLDDYSIDASFRMIELAKNYWGEVETYPTEHLSADQELSRQLIAYQLEKTIEGEKFLFHGYPINQMRGATQRLTSLFLTSQPLRDSEDVKNYIVRLGKIGTQFEEVIERMEYQREKGIVPPRFAIAKAIASLEKWIGIPTEKCPFYTRLADQSEAVLKEAKQVVEKKVYPAYRSLHKYLEKYLAQVEREDGVWALPDGDGYYAYMLKCHTTLDLSAKEIHEMGIQEVERIEKEIAGLLKMEGLWNPEKSIGEHLQALGKDPKYFFPNTDEGRQECLKEFGLILERSREKLGPLFSLKPNSPVNIEAVPAFEANGAPAAYYMSPSVDGSRPGTFFVNLQDLNAVPKYRMETLAIHEAEPGHHFERSLAMESNTHILRKLATNNAYVEGWALYCEKLAYEEGFYSSPVSQIGHLQDELLRAARLVVDTGIHWKRWSREEAIDYLGRVTGMYPLDVVTEIERYFVLPGQACSYKIGQMKILALRKEAKERLGDQFDLRKFHSEILERGVLPLSML
jgi:uncharacterized protein (DUF885 family)